MASRDIEDVIAVIDGRLEIIDEIRNSHPKLKTSLVKIFQELLRQEDFTDSILGHLRDDYRYSIVKERIQTIAEIPRP